MKIPIKNMRKLEFESFEISGHNDDQEIIEQAVDPQGADEQVVIDFSKDVISALDKKKKIYNKENPSRRVTLAQLRKVYCEGAKIKHDTENLGLWCMAKVNLFLRMRSNKVNYLELGKESNASIDNADGLILEESEKVTPKLFFNIAEEWSPQEEDFIQAKKDVKENDLSYNFKDIDELYVEPFDKQSPPWRSY